MLQAGTAGEVRGTHRLDFGKSNPQLLARECHVPVIPRLQSPFPRLCEIEDFLRFLVRTADPTGYTMVYPVPCTAMNHDIPATPAELLRDGILGSHRHLPITPSRKRRAPAAGTVGAGRDSRPE